MGAASRLKHAAATDRRLLSSSSLTFVSRVLAKGAQVVFLVVVARLVSVDEFASYSYLLALASVFTILGDTGVPLIAGRDISAGRHPAAELFWTAWPVVLVSAVLAAASLAVFGALDSGPGSTFGAVAVVTAFVLSNRVFDYAAVTLRSLGRFQFEAVLQASGTAVFLVLGVAVAAAGGGVALLMGALVAKEVVSTLIALVVLRPEIGRPSRSPRLDWRPLLRAGIVVAVAGTALALVLRLPLAVLGNTASAREVADFSAIQRFGDAAILLPNTAGFALLPGLAFLAAEQPERVRRLVMRVVGAGFAVGVVVAAVSIPLTEPMLELVFGDEFGGGARGLQIMLAALPAYAVLGIGWYALVALGGERGVLTVGLAGMVVAIVCAVVLVGPHGVIGAALSYAVALSVMAVLSAILLVRQLQ